MNIERAIPSDSKELSDLTFQSKAHWGFSSEQMELWRDKLMVNPDYFEQAEVFKLVHETAILAYYSFIELTPNRVKLDNMFIQASHIGTGLGKLMMKHFLKEARRRNYQSIELDAEPKAEQFYAKMGFKVIGQLETSIKNRFLPIMELNLSP